MTLFQKLEQIYPGITINYSITSKPPFKLSDYNDGNGPVISEWNDLRPQPSQAQLNAVTSSKISK